MDNQENKSKEQLILAAAEQEFLTKGYDGARTISIAKASGVTHAMLHYYFRTKEQLFERIVDEKFATMSSSMFAIMGDPLLPIVERIKGGIAAHFDFVAANPLLPRFVINEIVSRPERYEVLYKRAGIVLNSVYNGLQAEIDRAAERGEIERVDVKMLFISIMSLNIFTFVAYPFMEPIMGELMADRERFLAARKAENIETILRRIKKQ
ncbi:MAG: TetR/AcrR family transcriptional regulator [Bacteroidaceae bacterium]|nr:TetR/AcrR family transcriptional regulator [Bacteroidaceae bacterium]